MMALRQSVRCVWFVLPLAMAIPVSAEPTKPASAISWLTDSLQAPPEPEPDTKQPVSNAIETITIETLKDNDRDGLGILPVDLTGFPVNLWKGVPAARVKTLLHKTTHKGVPAVRSLFRQVLLAETRTPEGALEPDSLLTTRIDRLLAIGALSEAQALIELVGPDTSALFRRWFDIGLLTNHSELACSELEASPMLSPARSVQVFCLALGRDWNAAATALALGEELEQITTEEADLLSFFLDESLLEEIDPPAIGSPLTSLEFVIRESVGLPRPTTPLPIAFMHAELADFVPLRYRIEAGETLVREGVLPSSVLFAAYREEDPAASGGVWDRMAAVQDMDAAATADEISEALGDLDKEFNRAGLRMAASDEFLLYFSELPPDEFSEQIRNIVALYLALADASELARDWATDTAPHDLKTALSISTGRLDGNSKIENVLATTTPEIYVSSYMASVIARDKTGEAILEAINLLAKDEKVDEDDLYQALALLRATGLETVARKVAIETLLLPLQLPHAN